MDLENNSRLNNDKFDAYFILTSKSNIKEKAVKIWAKEFIKKNIFVKKIEINNKLLPEQPINSGIEKICANRISFVEELYPNLILENNYIISIENGIEIKDNKLIDKVCVKLKNLTTKNIITYTGSPISIEDNIKYPKIQKIINQFLSDYKLTSKNYKYDGCSSTFGNLVNKYYPEIPSNNWMKTINKKDRIDQIIEVLSNIVLI